MSVNLFDKKYKSLKPIAGIPTSISVDDTLSETSENPVQNKVVNEAIDKINSDLSDLSGRQGVSNPNLLDNGWFTINSRGQSEYAERWEHTVDRWINNNINLNILEVTDRGLQINNNADIYQIISRNKHLDGKTLTLSVLLSNNEIIKGTGTLPAIVPNENYFNNVIDNNRMIGYIGYLSDGRFQFGILPRTTLLIKAIKLELGTESTLYLDTPPNDAEELIRCCNSTADPTDEYANGYNPLISDAWVQRTWTAGEICISDNKLWKALVNNSEKPSEGANWHQTNIASELKNIYALLSKNNIK